MPAPPIKLGEAGWLGRTMELPDPCPLCLSSIVLDEYVYRHEDVVVHTACAVRLSLGLTLALHARSRR